MRGLLIQKALTWCTNALTVHSYSAALLLDKILHRVDIAQD